MAIWVEFTWPQPVTISAARIVSGFRSTGGVDAAIEDFTLQYDDGGQWKPIPGAAVKGNRSADWTADFKPVKTAKVRLLVTAVKGDVTRLWEVALFAPAERQAKDKQPSPASAARRSSEKVERLVSWLDRKPLTR